MLTEDFLKNAVVTWTQPYEKPVIWSHDVESECVGRVVEANLEPSKVAPGKMAHVITIDVLDEEVAKKIKNKQLITMSLGAVATSMVCNICGTDIAKDGFCGHISGQRYKDKVCVWEVRDGRCMEASFVNCPADEYAQIIQIIDDDNEEPQVDQSQVSRLNEEVEQLRKEKADLEAALEKQKILNRELSSQAVNEIRSILCEIISAVNATPKEEVAKSLSQASLNDLKNQVVQVLASINSPRASNPVVNPAVVSPDGKDVKAGSSYSFEDLAKVLDSLMSNSISKKEEN